ncbi:hypothetical protein [Paenibacillus sp. IHB B 3415]|uniref:hypothetical protein n=1 Tax=Paenibacillus sp. IHB B 3415 TaxID=867080 RepID=UPI0026B7BED6|nr:hypothetical protein [Paenibacillus sp. IHB B 3415]
MYTRIITLMNNLKLRTKLFLSFGCVVLIPVLIVGVFLTSELRNMALDNALEQITANVDRVKKRTGEMLNVPLDIAYRLSNDSRGWRRPPTTVMNRSMMWCRLTGTIRTSGNSSGYTKKSRASGCTLTTRRCWTTGNSSRQMLQ